MHLRQLLLLSALLSAACSSPAPEKKAVVLPPAPVTGLSALDKMFVAARAWAPDLEISKLVSVNVPEIKSQPGKAGMWQATFVSPSLSQSKSFTFAADDLSTSVRKGVNEGRAESWSPRGTSHSFHIDAAKVDSDAALTTAMEKGKDYAAKNPDMPIIYQMEQTASDPSAVWRVIWGTSASSSSFSVVVDATTGKYVKTMH